jgi:hypothetical protein
MILAILKSGKSWFRQGVRLSIYDTECDNLYQDDYVTIYGTVSATISSVAISPRGSMKKYQTEVIYVF